MLVNIKMERDRLDLYNEFIKHMKAATEVKQCYQVTGEIDFVLLVTVQNMQDYEYFCQRYLYSDTNIKNFTTHISMNRVKFDTSAIIPDK